MLPKKKGIPFAERLPSDPTFREVVRPTSGNHRIPQILAPNGEVIQDSVAIVDALEKVFPDVPAHPSTPRQRLFVHLGTPRQRGIGHARLEASMALRGKHPFHHSRFWTNLPQGDDQALMKYGQLIADQMTSYGLPTMTPDVQQTLDRQYIALLDRLEAHFIDHLICSGVIRPRQITPSWAHFMRTWGATRPGLGNFSSTALERFDGSNTCSHQRFSLPNGSIERSLIQLMMQFQTRHGRS